MDNTINRLVKIYNDSDVYFKRHNPRELSLYITEDGEFHLIGCSGFGSHCATNSRYSSIAKKQLYIWKDFDNNWKIGKTSCDHGTFDTITKADLPDGWEDRIIIKRPAVQYMWRSA